MESRNLVTKQLMQLLGVEPLHSWQLESQLLQIHNILSPYE